MSLRECMAKHTEREYRAWLAWLEMQWDMPSRTDCYLMQIACEVARVLAKNRNKIKVKDFKLLFGNSKKPKMNQEVYTALSKSRWATLIGKVPDKPGRMEDPNKPGEAAK